MKQKIMCLLLTIVMLSCNACNSSEPTPDEIGGLQTEITEVLKSASYDNLEIEFDNIEYYEGQELKVANIDWYNHVGYIMCKETMELYAEVVFPDLMGVEALDTDYIWDIGSRVIDDTGTYYTKNYNNVLETIDEYDSVATLMYEKDYSSIYAPMNWHSGVYISQGVLGAYAESNSAFAPKELVEDELVYDCRLDDLSDSYMLLDGEKTVAEAKAEMEAYFNEHYPIEDRNNGIDHEIWLISVGKIAGTDYYAYHGYRTFVYNGIPFTEARTNAGLGKYFSVMGECYMCESNKVDVTIGIINGYTEPEVVRTIDTMLPFQEIMDRVAYYLTGETKFQLTYGGLEYRLVTDSESYQMTMTPSWVFVAKNPNDDTMLKIYVDMETGEITSFNY